MDILPHTMLGRLESHVKQQSRPMAFVLRFVQTGLRIMEAVTHQLLRLIYSATADISEISDERLLRRRDTS